MVSDTRAILTARIAEVLLAIMFETLFQTLARFAIRITAFGFVGSNVPAFIIVDVPSYFEIEICFSGRCCTLSTRVGFASCDGAVRGWLKRLQATGSVCADTEVSSERWSDVRWSRIWIDLQITSATSSLSTVMY